MLSSLSNYNQISDKTPPSGIVRGHERIEMERMMVAQLIMSFAEVNPPRRSLWM